MEDNMAKTLTTHAAAAKLLRQILKESFPGTKFSVRTSSYAGGSSITVCWSDGPSADQVKPLTSKLEGKYFDGMIDYAGYNYLTLDGKPFSSVSYVFEERDYSDEWVLDAIDQVKASWGIDQLLTTAEYRMGKLYDVPVGGVQGWDAEWNVQRQIQRVLAARSAYKAPAESPTAARLGSRGDDGYGAGTTGNAGNGWQGGQGYAAFERAQWNQGGQ